MALPTLLYGSENLTLTKSQASRLEAAKWNFSGYTLEDSKRNVNVRQSRIAQYRFEWSENLNWVDDSAFPNNYGPVSYTHLIHYIIKALSSPEKVIQDDKYYKMQQKYTNKSTGDSCLNTDWITPTNYRLLTKFKLNKKYWVEWYWYLCRISYYYCPGLHPCLLYTSRCV